MSATQLDAADLYQAPARASATTAMLDHFLPTNGTEFAAGQEYQEYTTVAAGAVTSLCLTNNGATALPVHPLPYSGDNEEFPDVSYLEANGFVTASTTPVPSATAGMSASAVSAYKKTENQCAQPTRDALSQVSTQGSVLETQWMHIVAQIDERPAVESALKTFSMCLAATGVHAATITAFFASATAKVQAAGTKLKTAERTAGQLYARCIAPVEVARDAARATARAGFLQSHSNAIHALESSWDSALATLESAGTAWPSS
ncbi:MAG: hypothetical protein ACRDYZ_07885 [Acidimicrobiales bacterium]